MLLPIIQIVNWKTKDISTRQKSLFRVTVVKIVYRSTRRSSASQRYTSLHHDMLLRAWCQINSHWTNKLVPSNSTNRIHQWIAVSWSISVEVYIIFYMYVLLCQQHEPSSWAMQWKCTRSCPRSCVTMNEVNDIRHLWSGLSDVRLMMSCTLASMSSDPAEYCVDV